MAKVINFDDTLSFDYNEVDLIRCICSDYLEDLKEGDFPDGLYQIVKKQVEDIEEKCFMFCSNH